MPTPDRMELIAQAHQKWERQQLVDRAHAKWESENSPQESDGIDPSAAIQGFGNMATAGYLPEMTGAVGRALPDPNADVDTKLQAQGFKISQPVFNGATTDDSRAMQAKMAEESPYSYYGGGAAGAIASAPAYGAALKGLGIARAVPTATAAADAGLLAKAGVYAKNLGAQALQAGREGAAIGLASNPNTQVGDEGLNVDRRARNALVGGVVSGAVPVAAAAGKGILGGAASLGKWGTTKLVSSLGGVKPEVIQEYTQFADRINAAPTAESLKQISDDFVGKLSADVDAKKITAQQAQDAFKGLQSDLKDAYRTAGYDARDAATSAQQTLKDAHGERLQQLSGDVYDAVNQLKSDVKTKSGQALETLAKSDKKVDLAPVYSEIDSSIERLKAAGTDESISVAGKLQDYKERLMSKNWATIGGPDAKRLIQGLDQITEYSPMAGSFDKAKNAAFKGIRSTLDQSVKASFPEYEQAMKGVASDADLLGRVQDFGDKQSAVGHLGRIEAPNQLERKAALQELGKRYNADFVGAANPESLPQAARLRDAQSAQESLRPDRVSDKLEQSLSTSRQKSALDAAQGELSQSEQNLAPFKSLAPNSAGQTQAQQKLAQLGKGKNVELEGMFKELGKLTDTDFVQAMKDRNILAAFEKGATNGSRNTLMGALIGFAVGGVGGAVPGGAAGRAVDQWGPAITKKILDASIRVSKTPTMATIRSLDIPESVKTKMATGLEDYLARGSAQYGSGSGANALQNVAKQEPKGEDRWAQSGLNKLGIQDQAIASRLLQSKEGKRLLIEASDMSPGSPGMNRIKEKIETLQKGQDNDSISRTSPEVSRFKREPARRR